MSSRNVLSPAYTTAILVPFSAVQTFTPFANQGGGWAFPARHALPNRQRGLADITDSWSPTCRERFQTQLDFVCALRCRLNPDQSPEALATLANSVSGYQFYLTLGNVANYPAVDTVQQYYWVPKVLLEGIPHDLDLLSNPIKPIEFDLLVRGNSPAFFLPTDAVGSPSPITQYLSFITGQVGGLPVVSYF